MADEQGQAGDGSDQAGGDAGGRPTPVVALDDGKGQRRDTGGHQSSGRRAWAGNSVARNGGQFPGSDDHRQDADGDVDQEDPAPAGDDQDSANHRAQRRGKTSDRGPGADGGTAAVRGEGREDQADRGGGHQRGTGGLQDPVKDQGLDGAGKGA